MHAYHEGLNGFSPRQILHDGCEECEDRGREPLAAMGHMDAGTFHVAWERAKLYQDGQLDDVADCELPTLRAIWGLMLLLERNLGIPTGQLPEPRPRPRNAAIADLTALTGPQRHVIAAALSGVAEEWARVGLMAIANDKGAEDDDYTADDAQRGIGFGEALTQIRRGLAL